MLNLLVVLWHRYFIIEDFLELCASVIGCLPFVFRKFVHVLLVMLTFMWDVVLRIHILIIIEVMVFTFHRHNVLVVIIVFKIANRMILSNIFFFFLLN